MMEFAQQVPTGSELQTDVCIVGAGAAGISLALALAGTGLQVMLVEGGQLHPDAASQRLYEGELADPAAHSPPAFYRQRRWGGSTTIWGGRCVPFDPQDFECREYVKDSGWPISYDEVAQYYAGATLLCEAGANRYIASEALAANTPPPFASPLGHGLTVDGLERFSCPTDFGARYRERLLRQDGLRLLVGANAVDIGLAPHGSAVRRLEFAALDGRRFFVQARAHVLAIGGLETPRLLLASRTVAPQGVGNAHDVVGRYYMCHLAGSVGLLELAGPPSQVRHGYERTPEGVYCRRRISLTASMQRKLEVGNLVARLHFPAVPDPSHGSSVLSGIFLTRRMLSHEYSRRVSEMEKLSLRQYARHVGNVLRYPHDAIAFLSHWLFHHSLAPRRFPSVILRNRTNRFSLELNAEQSPLPTSRITLCGTRDALGMPRIRVDWQYARGDIDSVARNLRGIAEGMAASGIGRYQFDAERLEQDLTCYGAYGGHHIGTARMGNNPKSSVVDANCRVHGVANLFVAGSAVFSTSSQANPTLTLVALSLRLAERLARELCDRAHDATAAVT